MTSIVFYDFWQKENERKPIAVAKSFDEIQIADENKENLQNKKIILNNKNYKIINVNRKLKPNTITKHHATNDEFTGEILVETIMD